MDTAISYQRLWELFKKNFFFLLFSALFFTALAFAACKLVIAPKYQSTAALLVNRSQDDSAATALNDQQADVQLIYTYKDLITRPVILNKVAKELKSTYPTLTSTALSKMITVSSTTNSQIFSIAVRSTSSQEAKDIANETASVFKNEAVKLMGKTISNVTIVSSGLKNNTPVFPNTKLFALAGFLIGGFLAVAYVLIKEISDNTYRETEYIGQLGFNNLGTVNYAAFHKRRNN
ncbi:putative modulator of PtkA protein tyrosine kinase activity; modulation of biofilm formation [Oenococcus oeni]|uniref:YveK family protein n=1 Tax=Oenococcus oeni TaxID=1247 RepID=UPI00106765EB|nr:Wzz/FepE/Etk N-terminal domain-containing protein [Oenococcus oeni]TEU21603.1 capsular biosynthesis protein [Oenococcus oeni]TEU60103.1 capsular biosynthesis protein [Oenococcus oeni]TEU61899.1 capsular biosynthesis protein [Oenococcus oeni]SYW05557.1 putative modulator of PtkA protein tyrosine kinase activity; modulation of biofilm formation [Oenococcus oeni]